MKMKTRMSMNAKNDNIGIRAPVPMLIENGANNGRSPKINANVPVNLYGLFNNCISCIIICLILHALV